MWIWWKLLQRPTPGLPPDGLRKVQVPGAENALQKPRRSRRSSRSRKSSSVLVRMMATTTSNCATSAAFLADGDNARSPCVSRGREITHQELGLALLNRIRDELADSIIIEQFPKLEGRQMIMMIAPGKRSLLRPSLLQTMLQVAPLPEGAEPSARFDQVCRLACERMPAKAVFALPAPRSHILGKSGSGPTSLADRFANASRAQRKGAFKCPK